MEGRDFVPIAELTERRVNDLASKGSSSAGWVTIGVLADISAVRTGANGGKFVIWTLTDLKGAAPTSVSLFLFKDACGVMTESTVSVGAAYVVFNATAMAGRERSKFSLSVSQNFQLTKIGDAVDYGVCQASKKTGGKCNVVVNTSVVRHPRRATANPVPARSGRLVRVCVARCAATAACVSPAVLLLLRVYGHAAAACVWRSR